MNESKQAFSAADYCFAHQLGWCQLNLTCVALSNHWAIDLAAPGCAPKGFFYLEQKVQLAERCESRPAHFLRETRLYADSKV